MEQKALEKVRKKRIKWGFIAGAGFAALATLGVFMYINRPLPNGAPCQRSYVREDGRPKLNHRTNIGTRLQAWSDSRRNNTRMTAYKMPMPDGTTGWFVGHARPCTQYGGKCMFNQ